MLIKNPARKKYFSSYFFNNNALIFLLFGSKKYWLVVRDYSFMQDTGIVEMQAY